MLVGIGVGQVSAKNSMAEQTAMQDEINELRLLVKVQGADEAADVAPSIDLSPYMDTGSH